MEFGHGFSVQAVTFSLVEVLTGVLHEGLRFGQSIHSGGPFAKAEMNISDQAEKITSP